MDLKTFYLKLSGTEHELVQSRQYVNRDFNINFNKDFNSNFNYVLVDSVVPSVYHVFLFDGFCTITHLTFKFKS